MSKVQLQITATQGTNVLDDARTEQYSTHSQHVD